MAELRFMIIPDGDPAPKSGGWWRKEKWYRPTFCAYAADLGSEWRMTNNEKIPVLGFKYGGKGEVLLRLVVLPDFCVWCEAEPENPKDANAVAVYAGSTLNGKWLAGQIGYLPKEYAKELKGRDPERTIWAAKPESITLPHGEFELHLTIDILAYEGESNEYLFPHKHMALEEARNLPRNMSSTNLGGTKSASNSGCLVIGFIASTLISSGGYLLLQC